MKHLAAYQNAKLAERYKALVDRVAAAEKAAGAEGDALALTVARTYAKLLAYKDEYEVARLMTSGTLKRELADTFEGGLKIELNLGSPLLLSRRDPKTGRLAKRSFGAWMLGPMRLLAAMKGLRGTPLDIAGMHPHRRAERALIGEYEALIEDILPALSAANHAAAVDLAAVHGTIRGYDVVKEASMAVAAEQLPEKRAAFERAGRDEAPGAGKHVVGSEPASGAGVR